MPLNSDTAVGIEVPVHSFNMQDVGVPLNKIVIESELFASNAVVGVCPGFPIKGLSLIMENDLIWGCVLVTPHLPG